MGKKVDEVLTPEEIVDLDENLNEDWDEEEPEIKESFWSKAKTFVADNKKKVIAGGLLIVAGIAGASVAAAKHASKKTELEDSDDNFIEVEEIPEEDYNTETQASVSGEAEQ